MYFTKGVMEQGDISYYLESEDEEVSLVCADVLVKHPEDFLVLVSHAEQEVSHRRSRLVPWVRKVYRERERLGQTLDDCWWSPTNGGSLVFEIFHDVVDGVGLSADFVRAKPETEDCIHLNQVLNGQVLTYSDSGACRRIQDKCVRRRQEERDEERQRSDCWCGLTQPLLWEHFFLLRTELAAYFLLSLFEGLEEGPMLHRDVLIGAVGVLHLLLSRARNRRRRVNRQM